MIDSNTQSWKQNLDQLKQQHSEIAKLVVGKKVAYIDIPLHYNVGDTLIYLGTEQFIDDHEVNVIHRAFQKNINHNKLKQADVIMLHGGGNFGDLYLKHQKLRESIVKQYPDKQIVLLPQTIFFKSKAAQEKSANIFSSHPDVTMLVRDKRSYEIAKHFSDKVMLMPDMAHSLHPLVDAREVINKDTQVKRVLNLKRKDIESSGTSNEFIKKEFDWVNMLTLSDHMLLKYFKKMQKLPILKYKLAKDWKIQSDALLFTSSNYFLQHELVHTDRLHGLILSVLLGRQVVMADNSYGKNGAYYNQWLSSNPLISMSNEQRKPTK
ncbi:polysaccharide pyruvyl transferase [Shewanella halifaxensis HAW-EB4]|uniref:Polysaccharide pyruvyl transferase n=1 Tax=Shewanella halifaxensis (strain HAW-EB4) TaxID=458817 RepID=B0TNL3_SHEHH|nr:polysaccharide pyruvyl transferase family protein [Shewanella halifaxensis]ABZ78745.1 polysaccharide pyruvyl transferase [Shewanella halifaxensis HAW-EB4]